MIFLSTHNIGLGLVIRDLPDSLSSIRSLKHRVGYEHIDCPPRVREVAGSITRPGHTKDRQNGSNVHPP